jgi:hypothetical protein
MPEVIDRKVERSFATKIIKKGLVPALREFNISESAIGEIKEKIEAKPEYIVAARSIFEEGNLHQTQEGLGALALELQRIDVIKGRMKDVNFLLGIISRQTKCKKTLLKAAACISEFRGNTDLTKAVAGFISEVAFKIKKSDEERIVESPPKLRVSRKAVMKLVGLISKFKDDMRAMREIQETLMKIIKERTDGDFLESIELISESRTAENAIKLTKQLRFKFGVEDIKP